MEKKLLCPISAFTGATDEKLVTVVSITVKNRIWNFRNEMLRVNLWQNALTSYSQVVNKRARARAHTHTHTHTEPSLRVSNSERHGEG
jgi:hypothetical protein